MTDNEKRAHDIAIAYIPLAYKKHIALLNREEIAEDTPFDLYAKYLDCYNLALESINRDFPEGK